MLAICSRWYIRQPPMYFHFFPSRNHNRLLPARFLAPSCFSSSPGNFCCLSLLFTSAPCGIADTATLYMYGVLLKNLTACYFDQLYSGSPEGRFYRIGEENLWEDFDGRGLRDLVRKFFWALELFTVRRGVGWNWKISSIPASKRETRAGFVRFRLIKWVLMYSALYSDGRDG